MFAVGSRAEMAPTGPNPLNLTRLVPAEEELAPRPHRRIRRRFEQAEQGVDHLTIFQGSALPQHVEGDALAQGMAEKSARFKAAGGEIYIPVRPLQS
jgi:hypothetical protein